MQIVLCKQPDKQMVQLAVHVYVLYVLAAVLFVRAIAIAMLMCNRTLF